MNQGTKDQIATPKPHLPEKQSLKTYLSLIFNAGFQLKFVKYFLIILMFLALFGNFIANDKPLFCKINGKTYFPIFREVLVDLGLSQWQQELFSGSWSEFSYEKKLMPLIPYAAGTIDVGNMQLSEPFGKQANQSIKYRHWLGTDTLGRDVLAGMIRGARIAVWIGFGSMALATLIGLFFGLFAGYYGDKSFKVSRLSLIFAVFLCISFLYFSYTYIIIQTNLSSGKPPWTFLIIAFSHLVLFVLFNSAIKKLGFAKKKLSIPLDLILMRIIEIFKTIPALILLLALLAIISKPTILSLILILAFLLWPSIARFSRAELLRIREEDYINSGKILGLNDFTIIFRHALPNAIAPIMVVVAFGISGAILLEATLSFLGLGLAFDDVSWGSMLSEARKNFKAWWLALFPGVAIFLTIASFNIIGDRIQTILKSRE